MITKLFIRGKGFYCLPAILFLFYSKPTSAITPRESIQSQSNFDTLLKNQGDKRDVFKKQLLQVHSGTDTIPGIDYDSLKNNFVYFDGDIERFYQYLYLKVALGIKLNALLTNLTEVYAYTDLEMPNIAEIPVLSDFPALMDQIETFNKIHGRHTPTTLKEARYTLQNQIKYHYKAILSLRQKRQSTQNSSIEEKLKSHEDFLFATLPILTLSPLKDYLEEHPESVDRSAFSEILDAHILTTLQTIANYIYTEINESTQGIDTPQDLLDSQYFRLETIDSRDALKAILTAYPFLQDAWVSLKLESDNILKRKHRRDVLVLSTAFVTGLFSARIVSLVSGIWGLTPEVTAIATRGVITVTHLIYAQHFARSALTTYFNYRHQRRMTYSSVDGEGLHSLADLQYARTQMIVASTFAAIAIGASAIQVYKLIQTPGFYKVGKAQIRTLRQFGAGAKKSVLNKPLPPKIPLGFESDGAYIPTPFPEEAGYYAVIPLRAVLSKGWGFLRMLKTEIPKGMIYGTTGVVLGILFYEHVTATTFKIITISKTILGIEPTPREIALTLTENKKIIRGIRQQGINSVLNLIDSVRDWENQKYFQMILFERDMITRDIFESRINAIDAQIKLRLKHFLRRYHEYQESRIGYTQQLQDINQILKDHQIIIESLGTGRYRINYMSYTVIYDASEDDSPI